MGPIWAPLVHIPSYRYTDNLQVYRLNRYTGILRVCKHPAGITQDANYCTCSILATARSWIPNPGSCIVSIGPHPILQVYRQHTKGFRASCRSTAIIKVYKHPTGVQARYLEIQIHAQLCPLAQLGLGPMWVPWAHIPSCRYTGNRQVCRHPAGMQASCRPNSGC